MMGYSRDSNWNDSNKIGLIASEFKKKTNQTYITTYCILCVLYLYLIQIVNICAQNIIERSTNQTRVNPYPNNTKTACALLLAF